MAGNDRDATGRVPSRTESTVFAYVKRIGHLWAQAESETDQPQTLVSLINWFSRSHGRWAPSTIRQYRAALRLRLEQEEAGGTPEPQVEALRTLLRQGPEPAPKPRLGRTSAKKRKTLRLTDLERLLRRLREGATENALLGNLIACNLHVGLRPCEFEAVHLEGNAVVARCGKATNGRSVGTYRRASVPKYRFDEVPFALSFEETIGWFKRLCKQSNAVLVLSRLSSRLARHCRKLKIRRVCFYTLRHVCLASAKQVMDQAGVAALAGHASSRTAGLHYARSRYGLSSVVECAKPDVEMVAAVRLTHRDWLEPDARQTAPEPIAAPLVAVDYPYPRP